MMMENIPFFSICLLIGGALQILCFLNIFHQTRKSKQWSTTTGKIRSSELIDFGWNHDSSSKSYRAIVEYQYQVDGEIYSLKKIYYGD
ncbi:hypothetical protein BSYN_04760 [Bacteroides sedimenti]|uniref:DUF3592 domain-containing protein n=1 Tax=Bacteroides sedimenti TaxID=2136147 RepID=A0ABM8IE14_9BACE